MLKICLQGICYVYVQILNFLSIVLDATSKWTSSISASTALFVAFPLFLSRESFKCALSYLTGLLCRQPTHHRHTQAGVIL